MPVSQQLLPEFSDIHVVHVPSTLQLLQQPNTPLQNPSSSSPSEESVAIATQPSPEATPLSCIDLGEGGEYTSSVLSQRFPLPTQDPVTWRNSQSGHFSTMSSAHNTPTLTSSDSEPVASLRYIPGASAIPTTNPSTLPLNQPYPSIQFASASSTPLFSVSPSSPIITSTPTIQAPYAPMVDSLESQISSENEPEVLYPLPMPYDRATEGSEDEVRIIHSQPRHLCSYSVSIWSFSSSQSPNSQATNLTVVSGSSFAITATIACPLKVLIGIPETPIIPPASRRISPTFLVTSMPVCCRLGYPALVYHFAGSIAASM